MYFLPFVSGTEFLNVYEKKVCLITVCSTEVLSIIKTFNTTAQDTKTFITIIFILFSQIQIIITKDCQMFENTFQTVKYKTVKKLFYGFTKKMKPPILSSVSISPPFSSLIYYMI